MGAVKGKRGFQKDAPPWNKGKTGLQRGWNKGQRGMSTGVASTPEAEAERRRKISAACKGRTGGYREGSGRGKKGTYDGIYCDSSWELAFVLWCRLKGYAIKRATKRFPYKWKGKVRNYLPDFLVKKPGEKAKYVEVKGYVTPQWKAKQAAFPHDLIVVSALAMRSILSKVVEHHGKSFLKMYE